MWHYRWIFDRRSVALLLPGAAVGIAAGTLFFGYSLDNTAILRTGVGVLALVFVGFQVLRTLAVLAPLTFVGVRLGILLNRHFSDLWFNRVIYGVLLVTGVKLVAG